MSKMIEVEIDSVRVSLTNQQRIVILKIVGEERYLPIWIGLYEAEAITIALQEIKIARPQTHDLIKTVIQALNAGLLRVEIISLSDDVFYGNLVLDVEGSIQQVDCRPSDALALAARMDVPIMVTEEVIERAGITPEEDMDPDEVEENAIEDTQEVDLEVFEDFLKNLDLDDSASDEDQPEDED